MKDRRILRIKHVTEATGLSSSSIYNKLNKKSPYYDATFPRQVPLGAAAVGWMAEEIDDWLRLCEERR